MTKRRKNRGNDVDIYFRFRVTRVQISIFSQVSPPFAEKLSTWENPFFVHRQRVTSSTIPEIFTDTAVTGLEQISFKVDKFATGLKRRWNEVDIYFRFRVTGVEISTFWQVRPLLQKN